MTKNEHPHPNAVSPYPTTISVRVGTLLLEERDAVRRKDWSAARAAATERLDLLEASRRLALRRPR